MDAVRAREDDSTGRRHWLLATLISAGWAPLAVFAVHICGALFFAIYEVIPHFDVPMHIVGGVAIAFFFWRASSFCWGRIDRALQATLVFGLVCAAAVFWEFAEFATDSWFHTGAQVGLRDTLGDMLLGIVGGTAFVVAACFRRAR